MNLWGKKCLGYICLVLALFSCESETEIGEPLNPNGDDIGVYYAEIPVSSSVILYDSINTQYKFVVGKYADPDFGVTTSQAYAQFLPEKANLILPDNLVIDSVLLNLRIINFHGKNFESPLSITAHLLSELIERKKHYAFNSTAYFPEQLGSKSLTVNPNSNNDSIVSIKLALDPSLQTQLINLTKAYKADSTTIYNFWHGIKGLALVPGAEDAFVLDFDLAHNDSKIVLFHNSHEDSVTHYRFAIKTKDGITPYGEIYSNVVTDRSQTPLAGITPRVEFQPSDNNMYLQPGTGIVPKINVENIKSFVDTAGNVIINRADLVIGEVQPFSKFLDPPGSVFFYFTNETNKIQYVNAQNGVVPFAVTAPGVDASKPLEATLKNESYKIQLTDILEAYYLGKITYNQFLVHPSGFNSFRSLKQAKIPQENIKLKIYYTKLN